MSLLVKTVDKDGREKYLNPNMDIAHAFKPIVMEVAARLESGRWPEVHALLREQGLTDEQAGAACQAFVTFVATAAQDPKETMEQAIRRSGWFDVSIPAQTAYMANLGLVMAGVFFHAARVATINGQGPCSETEDLLAAGRRCHRLMTMPRWKRWLVLLFKHGD